MWRLIRAQEDGVSAVFVAITMVVLIGLTAFTIDAGALYQERRELQTGADASALAIAEACGLGEPCSTPAAETIANAYTDDNATDGFGAIDEVDLDTAAQTVSVITSTELDGGGTVFAPFFAQVLGVGGTTVRAGASAAWGSPGSLATLPLIISDCEWVKIAGTEQEGPPFSGDPVVFLFHDGNTTEDCNAQAGQDWDGDDRLAGGFGWLATSGDCEAHTTVGYWVDEDPGASPSNGCSASELEALVLNQVVLVPFFNDVRGLGANGEYLVAGFVAFYVTGYNFGGQYKEPSAKDAPCSGDERCLAGYVTTESAYDGTLGGPDRGIVLIKLTG